jgi:hypothetical protein
MWPKRAAAACAAHPALPGTPTYLPRHVPSLHHTVHPAADFGLARRYMGPSALTTICGTPQYVAPEIIKAGLGLGLAVGGQALLWVWQGGQASLCVWQGGRICCLLLQARIG